MFVNRKFKEEKIEMEKELLRVLKEKEIRQNKVEELKQNELVIKYIDNSSKCNALSLKESYLKNELETQKMLCCNHYFVINDIDTYFDGHKLNSDYIVTCIHCGLTNKYIDDTYKRDCLMNQIIRKGGMSNSKYHGRYDIKELDEIKSMYDKFKDDYPNMDDDEIEKHIALIKKRG